MSSRAVGRELPATLALSAPIIAGFIGQMLMGWADSIMVGRLGTVPLAACAFANTVLMVFFVFGFGAMASVAILCSQAFGAKRHREVGEVLLGGCLFATALSVVLGLGVAAAWPWLGHLGQPPEVVAKVGPYLLLVTLSLWPSLLFTAGKACSEALSRPWMPFWIVLSNVLLNVLLNWIFIFGNWGAPAMGLTGAGLATLLARIFGAVLIFATFYHARSFRQFLPSEWAWKKWSRHVPGLLRLGLPSAFQVLGEVGAFALASLMMGWISVQALAAHQIAMTATATTFMIPLGLGIALTVRVGQARGAGELERLRPIALGAHLLTFGVMLLTAALFLLGGRAIASLFVEDPAVIQLAATLLVVAGIFQIFDGAQVVSVGGLRGLGDVRVPMLLAYVCYWVVALPLSALFAFVWSGGAPGIWIGLAAGLALASFLLTARLWNKTKPRTTTGGLA
jgi:MATE family multidrug resistance protein